MAKKRSVNAFGESNDCNNIGSQGIGIFLNKNGTSLNFKNLDNPTGKISIIENNEHKTIEFGININKEDVGLGNVPNTDTTIASNISIIDTDSRAINGLNYLSYKTVITQERLSGILQ